MPWETSATCRMITMFSRVPFHGASQAKPMRRAQDFQTGLHPQARTNNLLVSVMIRSLPSIDLRLCLRIRTDSDE